ncbi:MAG TPA: bifunctional 2-methylcitrate synthase/citrate synthase [Acidimicrobiia bacterium]|nr:bifunctional 2-methylcitrate synthase/citrate synthase [Acidimicrobiia bacterium]
MPEEIHRGLAGVVVDETAVSRVVEETSTLTYRGYPVQELAERVTFEDVAYLVWNGELPTESQRSEFTEMERSMRDLSPTVSEAVLRLPTTCHPMDTLRTAVSVLGAEDPAEGDNSEEANRGKAMSMFAKLPSVVALDHRRRHDLDAIGPDASLGFSENFFNMCFGEVPDASVVNAFDISMTLYAEHSFNASTFAARVVISTLSDIYSAVTAGIGALKGPLHGGANEAVMTMMLDVGSPEKAESWLRDRLANKEKVMGFGHRVYKHGDSRVPTMKKALDDLADETDGRLWVEIYETLEKIMVEEKGIHPNLDLPTGPAYYMMGFDIPTFTPLFVMSRITGWTAHIIEQLANNVLIRPLSSYTGQPQRHIG